MVNVVGLFRELGRGIDNSAQSIHEVAGLFSAATAGIVAEYLRSGVPVFDVMQSTIDPFDSSKSINGGPSLYTDGVWVWRNDLAYFVENYHVLLPSDFLSHALEKRRFNEDAASLVARWEEVVAAYDLAERGAVVGE